MSNWKNIDSWAAGYAALFLFVFALTLYFSFDANVLKPLLDNAVAGAGLKLDIEDISLHHLVGLDLKDLSVSPANPDPEKSAEPMKIDRLILSPSLSSIPGMISALKSGSAPPASVSFNISLGGGEVSGNYDMDKTSLDLATVIKDLPLDKITLPAFYYKDLKLSGKVNAEVALQIQDRMKPETWNGKIQVDIDKPRISDFQVVGLSMAGVSMDKGTLVAAITAGTLKLNPLKLQGDDVPLSLTGTIALRQPLGQSILDVSGPLKISEAYKQKNPLLSTYAPSSDNFSYKGALGGLFPGL